MGNAYLLGWFWKTASRHAIEQNSIHNGNNNAHLIIIQFFACSKALSANFEFEIICI